MDDREVLSGRGWHGDMRNAVDRRRERGEERERKIADGVAKFGTVGSVPGINGVERFELRHTCPFHYSHQIQAGVWKSPGAVGESDQRKQRARSPDFGIRNAGGGCFQGGKSKDDVANCTRPNEQAAISG